MKVHYKTQREKVAGSDLYQEMGALIKKHPRTWRSACAVLGLVGGVVAPVVGAVADVTSWFIKSGMLISRLRTFGIASYVASFLLLAVGAFCLDSLEAETAAPVPTIDPQHGELAHAKPSRRIAGRKDSYRLSRTSLTVLLGALFLLLLPASGSAQQTIFNVPTTDVLNRGQVYAELDASIKPNDSEALNRFSSFVPRVVVGVGGRTEVGLNLLGNVQPGADTTTLVPTVKLRLYDGGDKGFRVVAGDHLYVPVRNRPYNVGNYSYVDASRAFGRTRLTAGAFHYSRDVVAPNAQRAGGQFGFEQTINSRVTMAADWLTGRHANGYFTPGIVFKPTRDGRLTGYAGYSVGNTNANRGNHFFLLELGYNFN